MSSVQTQRTDSEAVEDFAHRARTWLAANLPRTPINRQVRRGESDEAELARIRRCRELQRMLFDGGFAGICVPTAYGGLGLTPEYQIAFNKELRGYEYPDIQIPTFTPCMAIILEFGTEEQRRRQIPPILRGEAFWMQLLSEPSGGSDVAGALTTAVRDGDEWVLNGSKIWTTGAWWADWGLCLARTNWDVPKHRGLSVFMLKIHQPGVKIHRIEMLNGSREFCQEFMTDVRVPDADRIGEVDQGWTVASRWMSHERAFAGGTPYVTAPSGRPTVQAPAASPTDLLRLAHHHGRLNDRDRALIGEMAAGGLVGAALTSHISNAIAGGTMTDQAAAIIRLFLGVTAVRNASITFDLAGATAVAWSDNEDEQIQAGIRFLMRQASCIGGGTTEISRNVISERVLGMPREWSVAPETPFRDVPRSPSSANRRAATKAET